MLSEFFVFFSFAVNENRIVSIECFTVTWESVDLTLIDFE